MSDSKAGNALLGINVGFGVLFMLAPKTSMRMFGVDPEANRPTAYAVRYLGARVLLLAVLLGTGGDARQAVLKVMPVIAATDVTANLLAAATGEVSKKTIALGSLTSAVVIGLGLAAGDE